MALAQLATRHLLRPVLACEEEDVSIFLAIAPLDGTYFPSCPDARSFDVCEAEAYIYFLAITPPTSSFFPLLFWCFDRMLKYASCSIVIQNEKSYIPPVSYKSSRCKAYNRKVK